MRRLRLKTLLSWIAIIFVVSAIGFFGIQSPHVAFGAGQQTQTTSQTPTQTTSQTPTQTQQPNPTGQQASQNSQPPPLPSPWDCITNPGTCGLYLTLYAINSAGQLVISMGTTLVRMGIDLGSIVFSSPFVQMGFSVTLALANLAFVLAIIIIALATIIRNDTFGLKQTLWKVIVMAILVNFGLVITGPIVSLSNDAASYFMTALVGNKLPANKSQSEGVVEQLSSMFQYQAFLQPTASSTHEECMKQFHWHTVLSTYAQTGGNSAMGEIPTYGAFGGQDIQQKINQEESDCEKIPQTTFSVDVFWQNILNIIFSIVMVWISAWVFVLMGVLLMIRFAVLEVLLILLPFAWLAWVFPGFSSNFSKWWNEFIKWSFFPVITFFFLYLAFIVYSQHVSQLLIPGDAFSGSEGALATQLGTTGVGVVITFLNMVMMTMLVVAGVFAAMSLSGKAGDTAINGVHTAAKGISGWAAKKGGRAAARSGRFAYQKAGGHELTKRLSSSGVPLVSMLGRGIGKVQKSDGKDVEELMKKVPKSKEEFQNAYRGYMSPKLRAAYTKVGLKNKGWITNDLKGWGGTTAADWIDHNKDFLDRNGAGDVTKDVNKRLFSNANIRSAKRAMKAGQNTAEIVDDIKDENGKVIPGLEKGNRANTQTILDNASADFVRNFDRADMSKVDSKTAFGKTLAGSPEESVQKAVMSAMAVHAPELLRPAMQNMQSKDRVGMLSMYEPAARSRASSLQREIDALDEIAGNTGAIKSRMEELKGNKRMNQAQSTELKRLTKEFTDRREQLPDESKQRITELENTKKQVLAPLKNVLESAVTHAASHEEGERGHGSGDEGGDHNNEH